MDTLLDYVRLISYAIVILTSLRGLSLKRVEVSIYYGEILMAVSMATVSISVNLLGRNLGDMADYILTPATAIWALVHFVVFLKTEFANDKIK